MNFSSTVLITKNCICNQGNEHLGPGATGNICSVDYLTNNALSMPKQRYGAGYRVKRV